MANPRNLTVDVKKNKLTIEVDLAKDLGVSKSGKTTVVATTGGNMSVPGNDSMRLSVNIYKYMTPKENEKS